MKPKIVNIPYLGYKTHCYVYGDLNKGTPIIFLHGGPGGCIERYEALTQLANSGIPLILYDQLGSGYSRVPKGHYELWKYETFINELDNVVNYFGLKKFHLLGHSWGGMLALEWVTNYDHKKLEKLILFSTLPSTKIWNDEHFKMIEDYPQEIKQSIIDDYNGKSVQKAILKRGLQRFYNEHVGKKSDRKYIPKRKRFPKTNKEVYEYMWGKSELFGTGTLKDWNVEDKLHKIDVPTLIISGKLDESTPVINEMMNKKIQGSRWVLLEHSHHSGYNEEPELVLKSIKDFIRGA